MTRLGVVYPTRVSIWRREERANVFLEWPSSNSFEGAVDLSVSPAPAWRRGPPTAKHRTGRAAKKNAGRPLLVHLGARGGGRPLTAPPAWCQDPLAMCVRIRAKNNPAPNLATLLQGTASTPAVVIDSSPEGAPRMTTFTVPTMVAAYHRAGFQHTKKRAGDGINGPGPCCGGVDRFWIGSLPDGGKPWMECSYGRGPPDVAQPLHHLQRGRGERSRPALEMDAAPRGARVRRGAGGGDSRRGRGRPGARGVGGAVVRRQSQARAGGGHRGVRPRPRKRRRRFQLAGYVRA